jgi:hypothetical protein
MQRETKGKWLVRANRHRNKEMLHTETRTYPGNIGTRTVLILAFVTAVPNNQDEQKDFFVTHLLHQSP